ITNPKSDLMIISPDLIFSKRFLFPCDMHFAEGAKADSKKISVYDVYSKVCDRVVAKFLNLKRTAKRMESMSKMAFVLAILVIGASEIRAQTDKRVTDIRS